MRVTSHGHEAIGYEAISVTRAEAEWRKLLSPSSFAFCARAAPNRREAVHSIMKSATARSSAPAAGSSSSHRKRNSKAVPVGRVSTIRLTAPRNLDRCQLRHGTHRGALQPLRQPSRSCIRRRTATDASALLHQRRRDELQAGISAAVPSRSGKIQSIPSPRLRLCVICTQRSSARILPHSRRCRVEYR